MTNCPYLSDFLSMVNLLDQHACLKIANGAFARTILWTLVDVSVFNNIDSPPCIYLTWKGQEDVQITGNSFSDFTFSNYLISQSCQTLFKGNIDELRVFGVLSMPLINFHISFGGRFGFPKIPASRNMNICFH